MLLVLCGKFEYTPLPRPLWTKQDVSIFRSVARIERICVVVQTLASPLGRALTNGIYAGIWSGALDDDFPKGRSGIVGGMVGTLGNRWRSSGHCGVAASGEVFLCCISTTAAACSHT